MIYGIGTDIVVIKRIEDALARHGDRFLNRILCPREIAEYVESAKSAPTRSLARFLSKRFAVKEAFSKALGTGIGEAMGWHDVRLSHDPKGKPSITVSDALQSKLNTENIGETHVSISDETEHAIAFVVLEIKK
ncbi:MAG: holo-ACP synthase [Pseudomonadota bacterium]